MEKGIILENNNLDIERYILKTIDKNIIALGWVSFFTDLASSIITTLLPLYLVYVLNEGVDKLGFVVGIATFVSYGGRFVFGYLSDKYNIIKPFVVSGYFISAISKPLLYFTLSWQSIATLRGVERIGKAVRSASRDTLISSYSKKSKSGKTFGFHKMMDIAGEMTGAIIAFFAIYLYSANVEVFKNIFAFTLIPGLIATVIVIFFVKDAPLKKKSKSEFRLSDDYKMLPLLFVYFGFVFFMFNESFFIIKAKESGIDMEFIPLFIVLLTLTQTLSSYYTGIKIDEIGSYRVLQISFLCGFLSMVSLYFNFIMLSFILLGIFLVSSINALRSYISINAVNKSSVFGFLYAGVALSGALGAIVIGLIWKYYGEEWSVVFSLVGLLLSSLFLRSKMLLYTSQP